jgi:hypothetical protein
VDFSDLRSPKTHIVPSEVVARVIKVMHAAWLAKPGQKGQQRNDSDFRRFMPDYTVNRGAAAKPYTAGWLDQYLEAWNSLP